MAEGKSRHVPIVVVGSGVIGATVTAQLSYVLHNFHNCAKGEILLLDRCETPFSNSVVSNVSTAWLNAVPHKTPLNYNLFNSLSTEKWPNFLKRFNIDPNKVGFSKKGVVHVVAKSRSLRNPFDEEMMAKMHKIGYNVQYCDPDSRFINQTLANDIDYSHTQSIFYGPNDGSIEGGRVANACAQYALQTGITNFHQCTVVRLISKLQSNGDEKVSGVVIRNPNGAIETIYCDFCVLTCGNGIAPLINGLTPNTLSSMRYPVNQSRGYFIRTPPLPSDCDVSKLCKDRISLFKLFFIDESEPTNLQNRTLKILLDNSILLSMGYADHGVLKGKNRRQLYIKPLVDMWCKVLPELRNYRDWFVNNARMIGPYIRPQATDGKPVIGFDDRFDNAYVLLTHSGMTLAPLLSEYAANEIAYAYLHKILVGRGDIQSQTYSKRGYCIADMLAPYRRTRFDKTISKL